MAMKLSEQIHLWIEPHRIPDVQDAFDLQEMAEEVSQLEEELLKHKDIAHNINESFQLERTQNTALKRNYQQFVDVMNESHGVVGLHLNGEKAEWDWLINNEWLDHLLTAEEQDDDLEDG